jgi:hypothetical protein
MPYMLRMAAAEERYRVAFAVQVKSCNWCFHKIMRVPLKVIGQVLEQIAYQTRILKMASCCQA